MTGLAREIRYEFRAGASSQCFDEDIRVCSIDIIDMGVYWHFCSFAAAYPAFDDNSGEIAHRVCCRPASFVGLSEYTICFQEQVL